MSDLYPSVKSLLLTAGIDLENDAGIKAVLIDSADYTYSTAHDFLNDVAVAARVGTPTALASRTINQPSAGVFDAADTTLTAVTGDPSEAILLFKDTGTEATSDLIAYIDGFSVTPNGGNIIISWDAGTSRIFAL